jgi:CPA1 family monovalent cation:H+ antiporter
VLATVIAVRLLWTFAYDTALRISMRNKVAVERRAHRARRLDRRLVGHARHRDLATALALPEAFPYRDFIQLAAFMVVLGTLLVHGLTLRPLLERVDLPVGGVVDGEIWRRDRRHFPRPWNGLTGLKAGRPAD